MDNAQKAIMVGVGLFITIIVIAAIMLITGLGTNLINSGKTQVNNLSTALQQQLTADYDDTTVKGSDVRAAVSRFYSDDGMIIEVKAVASSDKYLEYGKARGNGTLTIDKALEYDDENVRSKQGVLSDSTDTTNYVPLTANYKAELIRSTSNEDVIMGVRFTRIGSK